MEEMNSGADHVPAARRGRRPAGQETRTALLQAARTVFAESGYDGATVRAIATRAGVDAAMVNHWFGSKEGLFGQAVLDLPFDPGEIVATVTSGPVEQLGERIVRTFVTRWDGAGGAIFTALIRSVTTNDDALRALREILVNHVLAGVARSSGADRPELRAALCATQIIGIGMARYVAALEPVATADVESLVTTIAPTLQRYLTGDIDTP